MVLCVRGGGGPAILSISVTFCYCLIFCLSIFDVFVCLHSFFVCYVIVEGGRGYYFSSTVTFCSCLILYLSILNVFVYVHSGFVCYVIVGGGRPCYAFHYCYFLFLSDLVSVYSW